MSPRQSIAELNAHLREQVMFIAASCKAYDSGNRVEYKRMTAPLRIILHSTASQTSLLKLLNCQALKFSDTSREIDPKNVLPHIGLAIMRVVKGAQSSYEAPLDMPRPGTTPKKAEFESWWNTAIFAFGKYRLTRKDLVLTVAEKDGGVHVDPALGQSYYALTRLNALGWASNANGVGYFMPIDLDNPAPLPEGYRSFGEVLGPVSASIRQIAHEVLSSLIDSFPQLLSGICTY